MLAATQCSTPVRLERIVQDDGTVVASMEDTLTTCRDFYATLFSHGPLQELLWEDICADYPVLTVDLPCDLDFDVTIPELQVTKAMKKGTIPGPDGLSVEFYLCFWDVLEETIWEVLVEAEEQGILPASSHYGLIKLLRSSDKIPGLLSF